MNWFKKLFSKVDNFREALEDRLADVLEKLDKSQKVDDIEKELISKAIEYAAKYYGVNNVPAGVNDTIGEVVVDCLGKLNDLAQKQLRK